MTMDIRSYNRDAWNRLVATGNRWTVPVKEADIRRARSGQVELLLTPTRFVPETWLGNLQGLDILCLASGGGQQGPLLAAAGAQVTTFDNSPAQLSQDIKVARQHDLQLQTVEGDMRDLSQLADASFDMIFHPCSNSFVPETAPVWREAARVLRSGGRLLAGMTNPLRYLFDQLKYESGTMRVQHRLPYSDLTDLDDQQRQRLIYDTGEPLEFGHTLEQLLGGQTAAGLAITGLYEDRYDASDQDPLSEYCDSFLATRSVKLGQ